MGAKVISISSDDITYYTLPGNQGDIKTAAGSLEDTIFGTTFKSMQPGIIGNQLSANAFFKGFPGYVGTVKKQGSPTTMTGEACSLVSGKTYQITAAAKRLISRADTLTVYDNAVNHNADVLNIDYLTGKITFAPTYTVTGPVTITGKYMPLANVGKFTSYTLTQSATAIKDTNIPDAQTNGGYDTYRSGGLREVSIALPAIYNSADGWAAALTARTEYVIEVNPDGTGAHVCRGFFKLFEDSLQGNVGALEEEQITFNLATPVAVSSQIAVASPFNWVHAVGGPMPAACKTLLTAWENETPIYVKYLPDGSAGWKYSGIVTNTSIAGGLEQTTTFTVGLQLSGAPTVI